MCTHTTKASVEDNDAAVSQIKHCGGFKEVSGENLTSLIACYMAIINYKKGL